jgi:hypothetical protein
VPKKYKMHYTITTLISHICKNILSENQVAVVFSSYSSDSGAENVIGILYFCEVCELRLLLETSLLYNDSFVPL